MKRSSSMHSLEALFIKLPLDDMFKDEKIDEIYVEEKAEEEHNEEFELECNLSF